MVILSLTEKGGAPRQLTFDKPEVTIGRVQGNDVVLAKGNVSKRHCRILVRDGQFSIADLKSTNGTYVNGHKISEATTVNADDKIYVGDFILRVENAGAAEAAPRPPPPPMPSGPEAGSFGAAVRRPPPPPTSERTSVPPPPPPRRDLAKSLSALLDDEDLPPLPSAPLPTDLDLDDEELAPQPPKLNVPPLQPVFALSEDEEEPEANTQGKALPAAAPAAPATVPTQAARERPESAPRTAGAAAPAEFPSWLRKLFDADGASAVYVWGPREVEVDRRGRREPVQLSAGDAAALESNLRALAAAGVPRPDPHAGIVNVSLGQGWRMVALFPPVATSLCAAILRSGSPGARSVSELAKEGALSKEMQQVLDACVHTRRNLLLAGDRGATDVLLRALAAGIGASARVVVMAEDAGLAVDHPSWISVTPKGDHPDLMSAVACLRLDHVIVDLTRPALAADVLHECALGQEGTIVAVTARSPQDALVRMQALAAGGSLGAQVGLGELVAGSFDVVVHAASLPAGGVRVTAIAEPQIDADGRVVAKPLLVWTPEPAGAGQGRGGFHAIATSARLAATLAARGAAVPANVLPP